MGTKVFVSAMEAFFAFLCPLLTILLFEVNPGTGDTNYNYLVEVEAVGEIKSTHAAGSDNKAVGTKKEKDGEGADAGRASQDSALARQKIPKTKRQDLSKKSRKKKRKGKVGAALQSSGKDYDGGFPMHGKDFSAQIPVDASVPIVLTEENWETGMNCPCFAKCNDMSLKEKADCETDCDNTCQKQDYALSGQKLPKLNRQEHSETSRKKKGKGKVDGERDDEDIQIHGKDFSAQIPVDASVPIVFNDENFETGMNCPCFANCDQMGGDRKRDCEKDCAKNC